MILFCKNGVQTRKYFLYTTRFKFPQNLAKNVLFSGSIFILEILLFQSMKIKIGYYFKIYANDQAVY